MPNATGADHSTRLNVSTKLGGSGQLFQIAPTDWIKVVLKQAGQPASTGCAAATKVQAFKNAPTVICHQRPASTHLTSWMQRASRSLRSLSSSRNHSDLTLKVSIYRSRAPLPSTKLPIAETSRDDNRQCHAGRCGWRRSGCRLRRRAQQSTGSVAAPAASGSGWRRRRRACVDDR